MPLATGTLPRRLALSTPALFAVLATGVVAGCSSTSSLPPTSASVNVPGNGTAVAVPARAYDVLRGGPCELSADGLLWYSVPAATFPPIFASHARCQSASSLDTVATPPIPAWGRPSGPTKAVFIATSLLQVYSMAGVQKLAPIAEVAHVPMTWMLENLDYPMNNGAYFEQLHQQFGDDVESDQNAATITWADRNIPSFKLVISVEAAGRERDIPGLLNLGEHGFWGITWNSLGTDGTSDRGAPWGTYCADVSSYKRPSPTGDCQLLSFEWTARDLTRAYFTGEEYAFSTDPDDMLVRGGFSVSGAQTYARQLVDAYAAAGQTQPLVMMSQEEAHNMIDGAAGDAQVMQALYGQAVADGMQPMTLASAAAVAPAFSNVPRAVAFPYIAGGTVPSRGGVPAEPATIDFHDNVAGMTFQAGSAVPTRVFPYALDPVSQYNVPLAQLSAGAFPQLTQVASTAGSLIFHFSAVSAQHFGVAIWSDPAALGLTGSNVVSAGRAGAVAVFNVPAGESDQIVSCSNCTSTTFAFSL